MVIETCELAQDLIKWNQVTEHGATEGLSQEKKANTNDPAPAFNYKQFTQYADIAKLQAMVLDDK